MEKGISRFNIRVYLLFMEDGKILLSDEILNGKNCTKFPGGGLEKGESLLECAHRESMEELGSEIVIREHFYTTDIFVRSSFSKIDQVIPVYYRCDFKTRNFRHSEKAFDFVEFKEREESFRWVKLDELRPEEMTFPADRKVIEMLLNS